jgi:NAD(P)H-dependent flavin oxidoreductase YrpB (nitropropane dioxygenase family)
VQSSGLRLQRDHQAVGTGDPVGQVVGQLSKVEKSSTVIERWVTEYLEATTRLDELNEAAAAV